MSVQTDAALLCCSLYQYPNFPPASWDHYDSGDDSDAVCYGIIRWNGVCHIVLRGSTTFQDWIRDFYTVASPWGDSQLGPVHPGFLLGMRQVCGEIIPLLRDGEPISVDGHSLGAGRACILTALLTLAGKQPTYRVCFGEPKPGFQKLADILKPIPAWSYRNAKPDGDWDDYDLVTAVPFSFPPEDFVHPAALTDVYAQPPENDPYGVFKYHHMTLYYQSLNGTTAPAT